MLNRKILIAFLAISFAFFVFFAWVITFVIDILSNENRFLDQKRFTSYLAGEVNRLSFEKYGQLAKSLAKTKEVLDLVAGETKTDNPEIMITLQTVKVVSGASIVYVMNREGTVIACTPHDDGKTLTGRNYVWRPYFRAAMEGERVIYPALGVTTRKRGLYFSSPAYLQDDIQSAGVAVIKIDLTHIDSLLNRYPHPVALMSPDGVIFASNRPDWMYAVALPINENALRKLRESKQFADQPLGFLSVMLGEDRITLKEKVYSVVREPIDISIKKGWSIVTLRNSLDDYPLNPLQKRLLFGGTVLVIFLYFIIVFLITTVMKERRAEHALFESEKKYRSIFENALEGIFQSTPDGRFISANPSMARILGYDSPDELIHKITDIGSQLYVDPQKRKALVRRVQEQDTVTNFECRLYCKNARAIWVSIRTRAIRDDNGELLFLEGLLEDISERKKAKEALENANKELENRVKERTVELQTANEELQEAKAVAEAATRARGAFLANMSHEIRTPMNGVIAAADLAMGLELSPRATHYLKIIHSSAYALLGIINDILDFSKIEAGKLDLEARPFRLDKLLDRIVDMFINNTAEKGIELLVDIDPETPTSLTGDSLRLQQILTNLLSNAVKFTDKGGVILVAATASGKSPVPVKPDQVMLQFSIKDTGMGIPPERLRSLFKPFTQADVSTTRKYGGTGLGLSICNQLVEMMDGEIGVESALGKGSTFTFTVRLGRQPAAEEPKVVVPPDIYGLKVLVVDDCADSRMIMQKILSSFGFRVESVSSGEASLLRLKKTPMQKEPFGLVMMDWRMPGLDGIETSRRIRRDLKLPLPVILMTAFGKETETLDAQKAGITAYLTKPIGPSTLFNAIMDAFGKEALEGPRKEKPITTEASIYKKRLKGMRVLVAEDNPTNQEVALAVLEAAAIIVEIAANGKEAVEAVRRDHFDAVLMDIQMPEMDGYAATKMIREELGFTSLPIIAMTAHAMKGDEEKCREAGMDGYVSKPIRQERLFHALWQSIKHQERPPYPEELEGERPAKGPVETGELPAKLPGVNIQDALNALDIDRNTFKRILIGFLRTNKDTLNKIRDASDRQDWELLRQLAHSLKGSAANIGARALQKAAQGLEMASKEEAVKPPPPLLLDDLERALNEVLESLESIAAAPEIAVGYRKERPADPSQLIPVLNQLADALELADPEKIQTHMETVKKYLDSATLKDLEDQINNYDYEKAGESLKGFAEKSGIGLG